MKGAQILELLATVDVLLMRFWNVAKDYMAEVWYCRSPYEIHD